MSLGVLNIMAIESDNLSDYELKEITLFLPLSEYLWILSQLKAQSVRPEALMKCGECFLRNLRLSLE